MNLSPEAQLVILGAVIALVSSLVSLWVQHRLELKRMRREDARERRRAEAYASLWATLGDGLEHDSAAKVARLSDALVKRLENVDLDAAPADKLIELYLASQHHLQAWSSFQQDRIERESRRAEASSAITER